MKIECPSCTKPNEIFFNGDISCSECKNSFLGHSYKKIKKPFISATAALILGAFGTYKVNQNFFKDERYPINVEYELIDLCVNSSRVLMNSHQYLKKTETCICSLNKTMKEISFSEINKSELEFSTRFRKNAYECI